MMKVTLTDENGEYSVQAFTGEDVSHETLTWVCQNLMVPVLRAAGFCNEVIGTVFTDKVDV